MQCSIILVMLGMNSPVGITSVNHCRPDLPNMHKTLHKLWIGDGKALRAHLKRLDPEARRLRFGGLTADQFIDAYVDTAFRLDAMIFGILIDGEVRASAELRSIFG